MPRYAANLSMLYPEMDFLARFEAAARDGFRGVEYLFPYAFDAAHLTQRLETHGLEQVLFNAPPGGIDAASSVQAWDRGDRGTACIPGREAEFRTGIAMALVYAAALRCPRVHVMAGLLPTGVDRSNARDTYVANLRHAAGEAAKAGVDILIEPINTRDMPGYFLNLQADAHAIVEEVGAPNLKVQFDLYHCQIMEGDLATRIRQHLPTGRVGHMQIAGVPDRNEPDVGELNVAYLMKLVDEVSAQSGWQGWIGCEYRPARGAAAGGTTAGLDWLRGD